MPRQVWKGIPSRFWPSTERPWRVITGPGEFEDFATKAEAEAWFEANAERNPSEPFDAIARGYELGAHLEGEAA